ncbi:hypothetical protein [Burkholderia multivorans]|uniref:hypothetical protein n=1 Tax=Burkholderia multivorans TaxID=87883 RepID=UPI0018DB135E|nr:hypothetical protein [Burkholderia multivorans]MBH9663991.1 hypothetical protein [Burkholderia multivorans]
MLKTDEETIAELLVMVWQNAGPHRAGDHADTRSRPARPQRDSPCARRTDALYGRDGSAARAKRHTTESRRKKMESGLRTQEKVLAAIDTVGLSNQHGVEAAIRITGIPRFADPDAADIRRTTNAGLILNVHLYALATFLYRLLSRITNNALLRSDLLRRTSFLIVPASCLY